VHGDVVSMWRWCVHVMPVVVAVAMGAVAHRRWGVMGRVGRLCVVCDALPYSTIYAPNGGVLIFGLYWAAARLIFSNKITPLVRWGYIRSMSVGCYARFMATPTWLA